MRTLVTCILNCTARGVYVGDPSDAQSLMADRTRSIPEICRELGGIPAGTLYHYLYADGTFKDPGRKLLEV